MLSGPKTIVVNVAMATSKIIKTLSVNSYIPKLSKLKEEKIVLDMFFKTPKDKLK